MSRLSILPFGTLDGLTETRGIVVLQGTTSKERKIVCACVCTLYIALLKAFSFVNFFFCYLYSHFNLISKVKNTHTQRGKPGNEDMTAYVCVIDNTQQQHNDTCIMLTLCR